MFSLLTASATTFTLALPEDTPSMSSAGIGIGAGDLNHDGWPDLVITGAEFSGVGAEVYLQDPNHPGTFSFELVPGADGASFSRQILIADLDGDGLRDLVLGDIDDVNFYRNHGAAGPSPFPELPDTTVRESDDPTAGDVVEGYINIEGMNLVDLDGDRQLDVFVGWHVRGFEHVLDPDLISWSEDVIPGLPYGGSDDYSVFEDLDGDRVLDIVFPNGGTDIYFGSSAGLVPDTSLLLGSQPEKGGVVVCDLDNDGDQDLFRTVRPDADAFPTADMTGNEVWLQEGPGWSSAGDFGLALERTYGLDCGDIDNDGDMDLVVGGWAGGITILRNDGTASFTPETTTVSTDAVRGLVMRDFDRDGDLDLYVQRHGTDNQLYWNDLDDEAHIAVELLANVGTCSAPVLVDDFHASVRVLDPDSSFQTGERILMPTHGAGSTAGNPLHVGLGPVDPASVRLRITPFLPKPNGANESRAVIEVDASAASHHLVQVRSDDFDGDGIPNQDEGSDDLDHDGLDNKEDPDSDGDGLSDADEAGDDPCNPIDTDHDGHFDFLDLDSDGDGDPDTTDCEPTNANVFNQSGFVDEDHDGFGTGPFRDECVTVGMFVPHDGDCDDGQSSIHPNAPEDCDPIDRNCDHDPTAGAIDQLEFFIDADEDGFGGLSVTMACEIEIGLSTNSEDCADTEPDVNPNGTEVCDGIDNDCVNGVDQDATDALVWYLDHDNDGHGAGHPVFACSMPAGHRANHDDCDDTLASVSPTQPDQCNNGIDDNCDGHIDESGSVVTWYLDGDGDGWGLSGPGDVEDCASPGPHFVSRAGDCNDGDVTISPGANELCNGVDDNCQLGETDAVDILTWYADADSDGFGGDVTEFACEQPAGHVDDSTDCNDASALVSPNAPEVCDGVDNDCDLLMDEEDPSLTGSLGVYYLDADDDGFGAGHPVESCSPPAHHVSNAEDCDDAEAGISPAALEIPDNGIDEDCDGVDTESVPLDTDGDGVLDRDEWDGDADGDGLQNFEDSDSDNDGVLDGAEDSPEARYGTEPPDAPVPSAPVYGCSSVTPSVGWLAALLSRP